MKLDSIIKNTTNIFKNEYYIINAFLSDAHLVQYYNPSYITIIIQTYRDDKYKDNAMRLAGEISGKLGIDTIVYMYSDVIDKSDETNNPDLLCIYGKYNNKPYLDKAFHHYRASKVLFNSYKDINDTDINNGSGLFLKSSVECAIRHILSMSGIYFEAKPFSIKYLLDLIDIEKMKVDIPGNIIRSANMLDAFEENNYLYEYPDVDDKAIQKLLETVNEFLEYLKKNVELNK